jgi:3D (Asp-Asp-Asp) domain-containing protein
VTPVAANPSRPGAGQIALTSRQTRILEETRVYDGRAVRFVQRQRTTILPLPFSTRQVGDPNLPAGTTAVDTPGAAGARTLVVSEWMLDGDLVDTATLTDTTTAAAERVVRVGSKPAPPPPPTPQPLPFDPTKNYLRAIAGSATSYCLTGTTATGTQAGPGSIAVDPTVIKLGSHLYVPGYGYGYAVDTGSAIKGTLIDVWLTCDAAIQWGRRSVTIYVLAN